ncbi:MULTISPECIES: hypothetical protein [Colwellia]|uniref:Uncharacterized protein n=1 Tax=Colwellia psychrerythraea (strain 34H / ATCC BAA-681) TaxID=167879 RepID=Q480W5_COLP3|nr:MULTISPECIES: hypothetical protein [Colwellia]AAZ26577.1 hypothetical protein CPS_2690 [Colwellia psychrerythraea 34H]PKH87664.1 hypothetical protein CXF79_13565 [Colwellia sp. Bg11-28]
MADTNNTQVQITKSNNSPADNLVTSSATSQVKDSTPINNKVIQKTSALMRCFDLVEEANYSYVLGYN